MFSRSHYVIISELTTSCNRLGRRRGQLGRGTVDTNEATNYAEGVKNRPNQKKIATPKDIVKLAKKTKWRDVALPNGDVVAAETIRKMFAYAEAGLKRSNRRKRLHAAAA